MGKGIKIGLTGAFVCTKIFGSQFAKMEMVQLLTFHLT